MKATRVKRDLTIWQSVALYGGIPIVALLLIGGINVASNIQRYFNDPARKIEAQEETGKQMRRAAIEASLEKGRQKSAKEAAARLAEKRAAGLDPTVWPVKNSEWDGSVRQAEAWIKHNIPDPEAKVEAWSPVSKLGKGYMVVCKIRARNAFGGWLLQNWAFIFDAEGNVILGGSDKDMLAAAAAMKEGQ